MTPEEIKTLGHAFFDGKTLQYRHISQEGKFIDWTKSYCPDFSIAIEWRIKPDKPKKMKLEAWIDEHGFLRHKANFGEGYVASGSWMRIQNLDYEITLPEGE